MRIAIIGNAGSGKSTLATRLATDKDMVNLDLDVIVWEPGLSAVRRDPARVVSDLHDFCRSHANWIVEGCYGHLIEATLEYGPELIFLNPGLPQCESNCRSRPWEAHKYASREEQDATLDRLLEWVADYHVRDGDMSLSGHVDLFQRYPGRKRVLTTPGDGCEDLVRSANLVVRPDSDCEGGEEHDTT